MLEVPDLGSRKTKALISCAVTSQLICVFVFRICKKQVFSWCGSFEKSFVKLLSKPLEVRGRLWLSVIFMHVLLSLGLAFINLATT